ncbi:hypothetical protein [Chryseobacterium candidae]|uniref:Lipoprotein n=1 Tax=Chryseobacterium candidae TaxID=1978493 RepID=A0ABY2R957_9FLAO|nr:hypothetical protein [Chryseobacterium candidae]THV62041.1 hypothetical protein EK417_06405 [Chryseobacterium candidae]
MINLLMVISFVSCTSKSVMIPINLKGNYRYVDNKQFIKIEIFDSNKITIERKVEANRVKCLGNFEIISDKKIKVNCMDEREGHETNSINDFVPLRFNIKNEIIYLGLNTIEYQNLILTKK